MNHNCIVTIFGGTGFIGHQIVREVARTGARIRIATRVPARAYDLRPLGNIGQITALACNVHSDDDVARALDGATHAINLIGVLFEKGKKNTFQKLHVDVPARIGRIAAARNLHGVVHVSALGADIKGVSASARSKAAGEAALRRHFPRSVILQPSIVFGSDDNFFNQFARIAQLTHTLPLIGGGRTSFQPVYVGDVARATLTALTNPACAGQTYALGGPETFTFRQLLDMMLEYSRLSAVYIPLPVPVAKLMGACASIMPRPFITVDQVRSLMADNIVPAGAHTLADLGITATPLRAILPSYLSQYWPGGRFYYS